MEDLRGQIVEDLTDALDGEIHTDDVTRALYATDASIYEIKPLAVAFPRSAADVVTLATFASTHDFPLIPRGSGTGLAGGCLGAGVVVDFSRHMNQVISIDGDAVRVQPGVTRTALNNALKAHGRYFAPDPSTSEITTIGGMIGVDAAGSHAFRVGSTRDHVKSLQCVFSGGQLMELGSEPVERTFAIRQPVTGLQASVGSSSREIAPPVRNETLPLTSLTATTRKVDLVERLSALLKEDRETIRQHQPMLLRNCSGYMLRGVLQRGALDMPRLLAGSEGTLALFTEVTLHTMPLPEHRGMMVMMFASMDSALQAMQLLLILEPNACDLLDRRLLSLGRDADERFHDVVYPNAEAGLFIEFNGVSAADIKGRLTNARVLIESADFQHAITHTAVDLADVELMWGLPNRVVSLLAGLKGESRPLPFVEDIAVPPERISQFLKLSQRTFQKHEVTATLYAHAASGQLHLRPMLPVPKPGQSEIIEAIARDLYRHVKTVGGTISGEHGDGLSRTAFIRSQYGPLYRTFQHVKEIFDPQQLLNPNKIISNDGQLTVRHLRNPVARDAANAEAQDASFLPILQLNWNASEAMDAAARCNGCGTCLSIDESLRMCPFHQEEAIEEHSPRSKANLLRRLLSGAERADLLNDNAVKRVAESCFNCKQCEAECPSEVDIPHLMAGDARSECRHQRPGKDGLASVTLSYLREFRLTLSAHGEPVGPASGISSHPEEEYWHRRETAVTAVRESCVHEVAAGLE